MQSRVWWRRFARRAARSSVSRANLRVSRMKRSWTGSCPSRVWATRTTRFSQSAQDLPVRAWQELETQASLVARTPSLLLRNLDCRVRACADRARSSLGRSGRGTGLPSSPIATLAFESYPFVDQEKKRLKSIKAKQFDKKFDSGEDITKYLDVSKAHRPEQEQRRVNVDFPIWMIQSLDKEAKRLGVPRQSVIKVWVAERLDKKKA
jgi:hypothetical protein